MNNSAMIWGAGSGIGKAITDHLLAINWQVVNIVQDNEQQARKATLTIEADVTNRSSVQNAIAAARSAVGQIALWVYANGDFSSASENDKPHERWQQIFGANLTGAHITTHYSRLILKEDASLVFIGTPEQTGLANHSEYAWANSAFESFITSLQHEDKERQVILVHPVAVDEAVKNKSTLNVTEQVPASEKIADHIVRAYQDGYRGVLELSQTNPG